MEKYIDPMTWHGERELSFTPVHFVVTKTKITDKSKLWIYNNLRGRFSIIQKNDQEEPWMILEFMGVPAFEDPKEAILYELTWA
jgi:hypothetical protein